MSDEKVKSLKTIRMKESLGEEMKGLRDMKMKESQATKGLL